MIFFKILIIFSLTSAILACSDISVKNNLSPKKVTKEIQVTNSEHSYSIVQLNLKILTTDKMKILGLMHQKYLEPNTGVMLEYIKERTRGIWMKNMQTSIDVLFFNRNGQITHLISNIEPCKPKQNCPIHSMPNTKYIIETHAGFIKANNITKNNAVLRLK